MRLAMRFVVCTLALVAALSSRYGFAEPANDHAVADATDTAKGTGHAATETKAELSVTPVTEWDPDMELIPFNAKEGLRLMLAYTRTQVNEIKKDPSIKEEEKEKIIEQLEKFQRSLMVTFRSVNEYTSLTAGMFICPMGVEIPLQFLLPKKAQGAKLSIAGAPCLLLAMTKNYGADRTNGLVLGIGGWGGAQIANNDKNPTTGNPVGGQVEIQHSAGFILPLNGRAPVLKLGDIQGYYAGGGLEFAVDSSKTTENNGGSASVGAYAKIEGLHKPDVAILMGVVGRNDQLAPFHLKGEAFYFGVPYASDGSRTRSPTYPFTNIPVTDAGKSSSHRPEERLKSLSSKEILELIKESKTELKKK